jgi:hypothetical protein
MSAGIHSGFDVEVRVTFSRSEQGYREINPDFVPKGTGKVNFEQAPSYRKLFCLI